MQVRLWRRALHAWDPPVTSEGKDPVDQLYVCLHLRAKNVVIFIFFYYFFVSTSVILSPV